jgi:glyoxylase-like metal-dependent hydrolase (beta-lactamase superfamily II)
MHPSEAPVYYNLNHGTGNFIPVWDGDVIDLGNRPLEIVHIPGHTPGSISILDRTRRALIGGDPIQKHGRIYMFGIHRDLHSYIHGLKRVLGRTDFDCIYPSHSDYPVDKTVIPGLISGAEHILTGTAEGKPITVHGHDVIAYEAGENVILYDA